MHDHALIITGFLFSILIAFIAFLSNWITFDATKSVIILGTIALGFGGWIIALALIFFFVSSSLLTRRNRKFTEAEENVDIHASACNNKKRRDGYQVWANGFWLAVFCFGGFLTGITAFMIAAFVVIAVAAADTWATEIGTNKPGKTVNITTFKSTKPGAEGGISLKGTIAAVAGSVSIAVFLAFNQLMLPFSAAIFVVVFGIIGCFIDSFMGAVFSQNEIKIPVSSDFSGTQHDFNNSFINWASTGLSGILSILTIQIFF